MNHQLGICGKILSDFVALKVGLELLKSTQVLYSLQTEAPDISCVKPVYIYIEVQNYSILEILVQSICYLLSFFLCFTIKLSQKRDPESLIIYQFLGEYDLSLYMANNLLTETFSNRSKLAVWPITKSGSSLSILYSSNCLLNLFKELLIDCKFF